MLPKSPSTRVTLSKEEYHKTLKGIDIKARGKGGTSATPGKKNPMILRRCLKY